MILFFLFITVALAHSPVLLSSVQTLTLKAGHQTASRRGPPVPQLQCVGGNCDDGAKHVQVMQCNNKGLDSYGMPQWECKAEVPAGWRLGTTDVSCEGFANSEDSYILAGSCGVEYTIHGPPPTQPKPIYRPPPPPVRREESKPVYRPPPVQKAEPSFWSKVMDALLFIFVLSVFSFCLLLFYCCFVVTERAVAPPSHGRHYAARHVPVVQQPVYPVVAPMSGGYGYSPVTCTGASDFAAGYVVGASSHQPTYYPPPPPPRREPSPPRREPSPPRREPSPEPVPTKVTSTGYGTTKRR